MADEASVALGFVKPGSQVERIKEFVHTLEAEDPARFNVEVTKENNKFLRFAHSSMQGIRDEMEDRYCAHIDVIKEFFPHDKKSGTYVAFFGLFDGHGGNRCADYCSRQLINASLQVLAPEKKLEQLLENLGNDEMLKRCFVVADEAFRSTERVQEREAQGKRTPFSLSSLDQISGSTAVVAWIVIANENENDSKCDVIVASAGDSRCVLYDKGQTTGLTRDHKPTDQEEMERIYDAGSFVSRKRVNSCLAMSRALGDFSFKQAPGLPPDMQAVTPVPDVTRAEVSPEPVESRKHEESSDKEMTDRKESPEHHEGVMKKLRSAIDHTLHSEDDSKDKHKDSSSSNSSASITPCKNPGEIAFLVLACDGVWDVMSNEECTAYIAKRLAKKQRKGKSGESCLPVDKVCKRLCGHCVRDLGSTDNVSISIIQLFPQ